MAASNSMRNDKGVFSHPGHISVMNTAAPTESGTAMTSARIDETNVPKTNGSAPKSPDTGSQFELKKNFQPNCFNDSSECWTNCHTNKMTMAITESAQNRIKARKPLSAKRLASELRTGIGLASTRETEAVRDASGKGLGVTLPWAANTIPLLRPYSST